MTTRFRSRLVAWVALLATLLVFPLTVTAEKLKGFYSGSGGLSSKDHRVVLVEFAADGSAILEQTWTDKDPQIWHARWTQQRKVVTITFDAVKNKPTPEPLVMKMTHGTLVPTSWDAETLGVLGPPPHMAPFGGKNVQTNTVASCQALNATNPTQHCITWDSRH